MNENMFYISSSCDGHQPDTNRYISIANHHNLCNNKVKNTARTYKLENIAGTHRLKNTAF